MTFESSLRPSRNRVKESCPACGRDFWSQPCAAGSCYRPPHNESTLCRCGYVFYSAHRLNERAAWLEPELLAAIALADDDPLVDAAVAVSVDRVLRKGGPR